MKSSARTGKPSFGSILGTLNHLVAGDTVWLQRFATHPANYVTLGPIRQLPVKSLDQLLFPNIRELSAHRVWLDQQMVEWSRSITESDLDHTLHYTSMKGVPMTGTSTGCSCISSTTRPITADKSRPCFHKRAIDIGIRTWLFSFHPSLTAYCGNSFLQNDGIKEDTTLKIAFGALLLTCLTTVALAEESAVGFQSSTLADAQNERALEMVVWYPSTTTAAAQLIGDDVVFVGAAAVRDAPPAAGKHPLLVFPTGTEVTGAADLADQCAGSPGLHRRCHQSPGSTTHDPAALTPPRSYGSDRIDAGRVIDRVTAQPGKFGAVAHERIAVVGHSLGGWTALEIGGARFDPDRFAQDYRAPPQRRAAASMPR